MTEQNGFQILIIDDDKSMLEVVRLVLEDAGFKVHSANNGVQGIEVIRKHQIDAVLSDIQMAGKDGVETLHDICATEPLAPPFVMLSGCTDREKVLQALQLGAIDFISKPFEENELHKIMRRACEIGRGQRQIASLMEDLAKCPGAGEKMEMIERVTARVRLLRLSNFKNRK